MAIMRDLLKSVDPLLSCVGWHLLNLKKHKCYECSPLLNIYDHYGLSSPMMRTCVPHPLLSRLGSERGIIAAKSQVCLLKQKRS